MLSLEMLQILSCPECGGPVVGEQEHVYCANEECRRQYPIRDRIPLMAERHEEVLEEQQWLVAMARTGQA